MLGFFSKLFKSKTPAQDPQTQPENNNPTAAEPLPADSAASEPTAETQPENENTAAETAQAVDADTADVDTAEQGQPENSDAAENEVAADADGDADSSEQSAVATTEAETAADGQPENAADEATAVATDKTETQPENAANKATPAQTAANVVETAEQASATQEQPETTEAQSQTQPENEPPVRNWTMTAIAEKHNSWASAAEKQQSEREQSELLRSKNTSSETAASAQPEAAANETATNESAANKAEQNTPAETAANENAPTQTVAQAQAAVEQASAEQRQPENHVEDESKAEYAAQTVATVATETQSENAEAAETSATNAAEAAATTQPETPESPKLGWAARLKQGLTKSRNHMAKSLASVFGGGQIDEDLYEELETVLLTSDMGIEATEQLMNEVRDRVSLKGLKDGNELRQALKDAVYELLKPLEQPLVLPENGEPFVIMLAGINGAGKTTSIGKLAKYFQAQGKSVILAAGDTFRAAAREQLQEWGERNGVTVISQAKGDSAAVCFDAVEAAKARQIDIVLADTAGRLPTQLHLMEEIKKVKRVLQKSMPNAPHEIIVVLDANIGQNAINQVVAFDDALGVTGLIVTKLDGSAKGGVLAALASNRAIPVRYIGVGESIDDLRPFNAKDFVDALLD
nr:signal recognition particle-docking protein FtsY [uncultured Kingella sp.]